MPSLSLAQAEPPPQFAATQAAPPAATDPNTQWTLGATGALNYGNSRSLTLGLTTHFLVRRDVHQLTFDLTFNYGQAALRDPMTQQYGAFNTNAQNLLTTLRYDLFLDPDDSLFAVLVGRHDPFAGLAFRFQGQLGYSRTLFREAESAHRSWVDLGGDFTYDYRSPTPLCAPTTPMGVTLDRSSCLGSDGVTYRLSQDLVRPAARVALGYDNHMNAEWRYLTTVEVLIDLRGDPHWGAVRVNWRNNFQVTIAQNLAGGLVFNLLYDGEPTPGFQNVDTQTQLQLTYTLL
jgi:hypothetical protein